MKSEEEKQAEMRAVVARRNIPHLIGQICRLKRDLSIAEALLAIEYGYIHQADQKRETHNASL